MQLIVVISNELGLKLEGVLLFWTHILLYDLNDGIIIPEAGRHFGLREHLGDEDFITLFQFENENFFL